MTIYIHFSGKMDLNQRILQAETTERTLLLVTGFYAMRYALCAMRLLNADGEFDQEGCSFGFVVPDPNIAVVVGNDGVDDGQP